MVTTCSKSYFGTSTKQFVPLNVQSHILTVRYLIFLNMIMNDQNKILLPFDWDLLDLFLLLTQNPWKSSEDLENSQDTSILLIFHWKILYPYLVSFYRLCNRASIIWLKHKLCIYWRCVLFFSYHDGNMVRYCDYNKHWKILQLNFCQENF